jgi:hypothetical protein
VTKTNAIIMGFVVAWITLVLSIAVTAQQTQRAVAESQIILLEINNNSCGSWIGTWRLFYTWATSPDSTISDADLREAEAQFFNQFTAYCSTYEDK